jgi:DNA topoisomerase IB
MALSLANTGLSPTARARKSTIMAGVRDVADRLGDTPTVTRSSYIDPRVISRYESDGELATIPRSAVTLPVPSEAEVAVTDLLT